MSTDQTARHDGDVDPSIDAYHEAEYARRRAAREYPASLEVTARHDGLGVDVCRLEGAERLAYFQMRCARCNHQRGSHTEDPNNREAIGMECLVCQINGRSCRSFVEPEVDT